MGRDTPARITRAGGALLVPVGPPLGVGLRPQGGHHGVSRQSGFNQEVAKALVESGAIDLAKMTDVYKSFAEDALSAVRTSCWPSAGT